MSAITYYIIIIARLAMFECFGCGIGAYHFCKESSNNCCMGFQLAIEAQYAQCDATINNLTNWLNDIERRLASQESLRETVEEIKKQTMTVKVGSEIYHESCGVY